MRFGRICLRHLTVEAVDGMLGRAAGRMPTSGWLQAAGCRHRMDEAIASPARPAVCSEMAMRRWQPSTWPGQPRPACGWAGFCAPAPAPGRQSGCPRPPAPGAPPLSRTAAQTLCCEGLAWRRPKHWCGWVLAWPPAAPSRRHVRQTSGLCCLPRWAGVGPLGLLVLCLLAVDNCPCPAGRLPFPRLSRKAALA